MRPLVEQDHRVGADDRFEDVRTLAGVQDLWRGLEDLLDLLGVGDHHEGRLADEADREALAVTRATALDVGGGSAPPTDGLKRARHARSGGQLAFHCNTSLGTRSGSPSLRLWASRQTLITSRRT